MLFMIIDIYEIVDFISGENINNIHCILYDNTMFASVSFVLTRNLISNFPQTGQISNLSLINVHEQRLNSQTNSKQC